MNKIKICFIVFVLGILLIPWFNLKQAPLVGVEANVARPEFSWKTFSNGTFQKQMEKWWTKEFGSRNTMLVAKNTIYDYLNAGKFHSGYFGSILQGKDNVLYLKEYITSKYSHYNDDNIKDIAASTTSVLEELQACLVHMGKEFLFVMAPSKADIRPDAIPPLWEFRAEHEKMPPSLYPIWEHELQARNIPYVNGCRVLDKDEYRMEAFPDTGIHWSMYGAGLVLAHGIEALQKHGADVPSIALTGKKQTSNAYASERDIADLLNIWPSYKKGRQEWTLAEYGVIPSSESIPAISVGDSFSRQLFFNVIQSGFSTADTSQNFENHLPSKEEWFELLEKSNLLILTYTYPQLHFLRIHDEASKLLSYTKDIVLKNWHSYESWGDAQWSKSKSEVEFFNWTNSDYIFSFDLKWNYHSKRLIISVNDHVLNDIDLYSIQYPSKISVKIPNDILNDGINKIVFTVDSASNPAVNEEVYGNNRTLGVYCSEFSIKNSQ